MGGGVVGGCRNRQLEAWAGGAGCGARAPHLARALCGEEPVGKASEHPSLLVDGRDHAVRLE